MVRGGGQIDPTFSFPRQRIPHFFSVAVPCNFQTLCCNSFCAKISKGAIQILFCPLNHKKVTFFKFYFSNIIVLTFFIFGFLKQFVLKNVFFFSFLAGGKVDVVKFQMVYWPSFYVRFSILLLRFCMFLRLSPCGPSLTTYRRMEALTI